MFLLWFSHHIRCLRLPAALKGWQAYSDLKKKIDDFNECCPLLELMAHKSMKTRHWKQISSVTNHTFDVNSELFLLKNVMEAPLLKHKEDIEVSKEIFIIYLLSINDLQIE